MTKRARINYIDIVKGVAILAIVLGHVMGEAPSRYGADLKQTSLYMFLFSFHVPIFYLVSGILLKTNEKQESIKEFIFRKCKAYLWPYFTFSLIAIITRVIYKIAYHEMDIAQFVGKTILKTVIGDGFLTLWFIPALLIAEIIFKLRELVNPKAELIFNTFCVIICSLICIALKNQLLPLNNAVQEIIIIINRIITAYVFVVIGYWLAKIKCNNKCYAIIGIAVIVFNVCFCKYNGNVDLKESLMGNNVLLFWYFALSTSKSIIIIAKTIIVKCKPIEYLGKNSLIIMATHFPIPFIEILRKNTWDIPLWANIAITFLILMIIEFILVYLINNYGRRIVKI